MNEETYARLEDKVRKVAEKHGAEILLLRAPEDPVEKKKWARRMTDLVLQMQYVGQKCCFCGHVYTSVEDFKERNPLGGYDNDVCVCQECWKPYVSQRGTGREGKETP
jgi:hypothetical protein